MNIKADPQKTIKEVGPGYLILYKDLLGAGFTASGTKSLEKRSITYPKQLNHMTKKYIT